MSADTLEVFVGQMTVAELCGRTGCKVEDLLGFCAGQGAGEGARPRESRSGKLDDRVMGLIENSSSNGVRGRELADAIGATLPQIRGALKRLVDAKRIRFTGLTSARRYWAT